MAFDSTVGGTGSNSYVSVEDAGTYFQFHRYASAWGELSNSDKQAALVMATRRLDSERWQGTKVNYTQALKWPRYDVEDDDGLCFQPDVIPQAVKDATCDLALELVKLDPTTEVDETLLQFSEIALPGITLKMRDPQPTEAKLSSEVMRKISRWLESTQGIRIVRG
jgi:hypothetical protein